MGGVINSGIDDLVVSNCIFINSTSIEKGGAIYSSGNNANIINSSFINSRAPIAPSIFIMGGVIERCNFDGDDDGIFALSNVKIIKKESALTLDDVSYDHGNPVNYDISLKEGNIALANKKIILELFKDDYHVNYDFTTSENGVVNILPLLKNLDIGTWSLRANFVGDPNYVEITKMSKITVNPASPLLILNDISTAVNEERIINAVVNRQDNVAVNSGTVNFYAGDKLIGSSFVLNNVAQITYCPSTENTYILKAIYEDSNSIRVENTSSLVVKPSKIDVDQDISYQNNQIDFNLPADATGVVTITISSQVYTTTVDGKVNVDLSSFANGNYEYVLSYSGDDKYASFVASGNLNVNNSGDIPAQDSKVAPDVTFPALESYSDVILPNDAFGNVILSINNQDYTFDVVSGVSTIVLPDLDDGDYGYLINYTGDDKYSSVASKGVLNINHTEVSPVPASKVAPDVTFPTLDASSSSVTVILPGDATGKVALSINNKDYVFDVINGIAKIILPELAGGNYEYLINFTGDNKYTSVATRGVFRIDIDNGATVKANDMVVTYGRGYDFIATFLKTDGTPLKDSYVVFSVNGNDNVVKTDSNGFALLNIGLGNGTYNVASTNLVTGETINNILTIVGEPAPILETTITALPVSTVYNGDKYLVATLKDSNGNAISGATIVVNINGLKSVVTDENGQIKVSTNNLAPKTYSTSLSFDGSAGLTKSSAEVNIVVKKASVKLTASAKSFKTTLKTKSYVITLKNNKNGVMKNIKVSLKVNGKTYSANTNSKGQASIKITKLTKKGSYNAVITFAGNAYYNKLTKTVKITCK